MYMATYKYILLVLYTALFLGSYKWRNCYNNASGGSRGSSFGSFEPPPPPQLVNVVLNTFQFK